MPPASGTWLHPCSRVAASSLGAQTPRVSLWLTGLKETVDQLCDFVRLAHAMDVSEVYLQRLVYQLFALLFSFLMVSCAFVWRKRLIRDAGFLAVTISGAWLVLTVLRTKDPRYTMPLLGLLAILPGAWIQSWGNAWPAGACKMLLTATLVLQTYVINFGASWLPEAVVLAEGYTGSLRWDWNLYLQHYFHILGPPRLEDWRHGEILHKIARHAQYNGVSPSLGVAPDLPRFNANNFALSARLLGSETGVSEIVEDIG